MSLFRSGTTIILVCTFAKFAESQTKFDEKGLLLAETSGKFGNSAEHPMNMSTYIGFNETMMSKNMSMDGVHSSQFLRMIIKKVRQPYTNLSSEMIHLHIMGKKGQGQEEGVVVNDAGDVIRVHIDRTFAPIFYQVFSSLNLDVRRIFNPVTELPTTTEYVPTTTKEYFYIIFEEDTTTTIPTTMKPGLTTKRGRNRYRVIKNKDKVTKTTPKIETFYVDDEDESEILKNINIKE